MHLFTHPPTHPSIHLSMYLSRNRPQNDRTDVRAKSPGTGPGLCLPVSRLLNSGAQPALVPCPCLPLPRAGCFPHQGEFLRTSLPRTHRLVLYRGSSSLRPLACTMLLIVLLPFHVQSAAHAVERGRRTVLASLFPAAQTKQAPVRPQKETPAPSHGGRLAHASLVCWTLNAPRSQGRRGALGPGLRVGIT